jgi:hypothetical protein
MLFSFGAVAGTVARLLRRARSRPIVPSLTVGLLHLGQVVSLRCAALTEFALV